MFRHFFHNHKDGDRRERKLGKGSSGASEISVVCRWACWVLQIALTHKSRTRVVSLLAYNELQP